ncbi:TetR/AcrR family transcriptional regulator [Kineococcus auxinigenes]|uniref:TetR/AcrR family transcriptional regulator n=1 Tax=Kineococcus sp. SYSU DK033 TaxID=3383154 RepID=UPI003D7D16AD
MEVSPRAGITVARLVEAAADLADEVGLENVTVSALARRFGVADASLYSHVRSAADLRQRVSALAAVEFSEVLAEAIAGVSGDEALTRCALAFRRYVFEHPGRYAATTVRLPPEVAAASEGHRRIALLSYRLLEGYDIPPGELTDAVRFCRSALHGFVTLEAAGGLGPEGDREASWLATLRGVGRALASWPCGDGPGS